MSFENLYSRIFEPASPSGRFEFHMGEDLKQHLSENGVPQDPGIYTFERPDGAEPKVMYVGMAGTWRRSDAEFGKQGLIKRILNQHDDIPGQAFLEKKMADHGWKSVIIAWSVVCQEPRPQLPAHLEAVLVQAFLDDNGNIPEWNKEF